MNTHTYTHIYIERLIEIKIIWQLLNITRQTGKMNKNNLKNVIFED